MPNLNKITSLKTENKVSSMRTMFANATNQKVAYADNGKNNIIASTEEIDLSTNGIRDSNNDLNGNGDYITNQSNAFKLLDYYDKIIEEKNGELRKLYKAMVEKQKEIDNIDNRYLGYNYGGWAQEELNPNRYDAKLSQLQKELNELTEEYNTQYNDLFNIQELRNITFEHTYSLYSKNTDFDTNAKSTVDHIALKAINNTEEDYMECGIVAYDKDGNVIEDTKQIALYCHLNPDVSKQVTDANINDTSIKEYDDNVLKYLSDDEIKTLTYLYNNNDEKRLNAYIKYMENCAAARKGNEEAQKVIAQIDEIYSKVGTVSSTIGMAGPVEIEYTEKAAYADVLALLAKNGFKDGLKTFCEGLENATLQEVDASITAEQYKTRFLLEHLQERYGEEEFRLKVLNGTYELSSTIGNQFPTLVISNIVPVVGQFVGLSLLGVSAMGNARKHAIQMGASDSSAYLYGVMDGLSEAGLQYLLGGLVGLSGETGLDSFLESVGVPKFLASMLSEATEESVQEVLEPLLLTISTNGEIPYEVDWNQVLKAGLYGGITAGILNGGMMVVNGTSYLIQNINMDIIQNVEQQNITLEEKIKLLQEKGILIPETTQDLEGNNIKVTDASTPTVSETIFDFDFADFYDPKYGHLNGGYGIGAQTIIGPNASITRINGTGIDSVTGEEVVGLGSHGDNAEQILSEMFDLPRLKKENNTIIFNAETSQILEQHDNASSQSIEIRHVNEQGDSYMAIQVPENLTSFQYNELLRLGVKLESLPNVGFSFQIKGSDKRFVSSNSFTNDSVLAADPDLTEEDIVTRLDSGFLNGQIKLIDVGNNTDRISTAKNRVFSTSDGLAFGKNNPISLHTSSSSVYRITGMSQIADIINCSHIRPKEGKINGGHTNEVFWAMGSDNLFYFDKRPVLETSKDKVIEGQIGALSLDDLTAVWIFDESKNCYVNKIDAIKQIRSQYQGTGTNIAIEQLQSLIKQADHTSIKKGYLDSDGKIVFDSEMFTDLSDGTLPLWEEVLDGPKHGDNVSSLITPSSDSISEAGEVSIDENNESKRKFIDNIKSQYGVDEELLLSVKKDFGNTFFDGLVFYYNEKSVKEFFNTIVNTENYETFRRWTDFLSKQNLLYMGNIPEVIFTFLQHGPLIENILANPILDEEELSNLVYIIHNDYRWFNDIKTIEDLKNIRTVHKNAVDQEVEELKKPNTPMSSERLKQYIRFILFGRDLYEKEFVELNLGDQIPAELRALYQIREEIDSIDDFDELCRKYDHIMDMAPSLTYREIQDLNEWVKTQIWNNAITRPNPQTLEYTEEGIPVYHYTGQPFFEVGHTMGVRGGANYRNAKLNLVEHPELWNTSYGTTYVSFWAMNDTHLRVAFSESDSVMAGVSKFHPYELLNFSSDDAATPHELAKKIRTKDFVTPDAIMVDCWRYPEIVTERIVKNERIPFDHIICFDGIINEGSKRWAKYYDIPIYMIHRQQYRDIIAQKQSEYLKSSLTSVNKDKIRELLFSGSAMQAPLHIRHFGLAATGGTTMCDRLIKTLDVLEGTYKTGVISDIGYGEWFSYVAQLCRKNKVRIGSMRTEDVINYINMIHNVALDKVTSTEFSQEFDNYYRYMDETLRTYMLFKACESGLYDREKALELMDNWHYRCYSEQTQKFIQAYIDKLEK